MYLRSIEMQGFKSFANKIVLDFHNGITGIVGPNGSGKSNVADAVRWVLGEQSAKQLRGQNMQDVIFAGTENRRPLGFAYVSITLDNSDHVLPIEYNEVTVSRRVYRSGESEYLINKSPCRLKDVQELFYDTGIGKEGYSIIGQGQIDKILSGKPEDRRELFDEAAGIVKYKKRKEAAEKKLDSERANLLRIDDILSELENRVLPLKEQSDKAKKYLSLKENLKQLELALFIKDNQNLSEEKDKISKNMEIVHNEYEKRQNELEEIKKQNIDLETGIKDYEIKIEEIRNEENKFIDEKNEIEKEISILKEKINNSKENEDRVLKRIKEFDEEKKTKEDARENTLKENENVEKGLNEIRENLKKYIDKKVSIENKISDIDKKINTFSERIIEILNENTSYKQEEQKYITMKEQAELTQNKIKERLLKQKSDKEELLNIKKEKGNNLNEIQKEYKKCSEKTKELEQKILHFEIKKRESDNSLKDILLKIGRTENTLEVLSSMEERYEGYLNSVKTVMEYKNREPKILGVVSDLITVDRKYEIAIETALGGSIQNIVTEDEDIAKKMISILKEKRAGRATFLPLTSVKLSSVNFNNAYLNEKGVIGAAATLTQTDRKFLNIINYLLGRIIVIDTMDNAVKFAKKYKYKEHIVTLEGEYLRPGGSLTGGAFKNRNNLLGRSIKIETLRKELKELSEKKKQNEHDLSELDTALTLNKEDLSALKDEEKELLVKFNTAKIEYEQSDKNLSISNERELIDLSNQEKIEKELNDLEDTRKKAKENIDNLFSEEKEIKKNIEVLKVEKKKVLEESPDIAEKVSAIRIDESKAIQKKVFIEENLDRISKEIDKIENSIEELKSENEDRDKKKDERLRKIDAFKKRIGEIEKEKDNLLGKRNLAITNKDEMEKNYKGSFERRADISDRINALSRDLERLKERDEKITEEIDSHTDYIWNEYELTLRMAKETVEEKLLSKNSLKKDINIIKEDIREIGNVNVNAIEEYKEVGERYEFLKKQHDDIMLAEESLLKVISDLDNGMRKQFEEKFKDIQREFDKSFKLLFGGGKGRLELFEGEDILLTGIKIIAEPPGKKLINMMQMSGGEKALTAIALLFAIQTLKPSPFCLLDEIEAALDDSNVSRFAKYLKKLSKNTQFIVITHRRGTMSSADRLYGITMQEKGVSVLVSVNLIESKLN